MRASIDKIVLLCCVISAVGSSLTLLSAQVVEMCWSQQLFDAMIHVYNAGLDDYTTPLIELLLQLRAALKKGKPVPGMCSSLLSHHL